MVGVITALGEILGDVVRYLTTKKAAEHIATETGIKVSPATIWRWATRGIGEVRLQHGRLGNRILTTAEWLDQFMVDVAQVKRAGRIEPVLQLQPKPKPPREGNDRPKDRAL